MMKLLKNSMMLSIILLVAVLFGCSTSPPAVSNIPPTAEDTQAKNLEVPAGKSLVYFYYPLFYKWGNPIVSLDGASSPFNRGLYVLWEVEPGEHRMEVDLVGHISGDGKTKIPLRLKTEPNTTYFTYLRSYDDPSAGRGETITLYEIANSKNLRVKDTVGNYRLIGWYQDGRLVYQNLGLLEVAGPQ